MKKELVDLQPKLEQAKIDNNKMMKVNILIQPQHQPRVPVYMNELNVIV